MAHLKSIPGGVLLLKIPPCRIGRPGQSRQANSRAVDGGAGLHAVGTSSCRSTGTPQSTNTQANPGAAVTGEQGHRRNCSPRRRLPSSGFAPARRSGPMRLQVRLTCPSLNDFYEPMAPPDEPMAPTDELQDHQPAR